MPVFILTALGSLFSNAIEFLTKKLGWQLAAITTAFITFSVIFTTFIGTTNLIIPQIPSFVVTPFSWIMPEDAQTIIGSIISLRIATMVICWKISFIKSVTDVASHG